MALINIPRAIFSGFRSLARIADPAFTSLVDGMKGVPIGALPSSYKTTLKAPLVPPADLEVISRAVFSLSGLHKKGVTVKETTEELFDSYKELDNSHGLSESELSKLKERLEVVLGCSEKLRVTYKAANLSESAGKYMRDGQIITDLRYIFSDGDIDSLGPNSIVVHNLCINYVEDGSLHSAYFAMDDEDLRTLKEAIIRAERKEEMLRNREGDNVIKFLK